MADELFKTAPPEVVRYFRAKRSLPSFDWRDVAPQEHAYSWTVAKSVEHDILEDIRQAVDDAIVNRVPFEEFRQHLEPILREKGWWGRRMQTDPKDGAPKVVQLGSPRRLRTIYWANTRTAHAAGEWERTQRTKRFLPFLIYTLSVAERRRPEHMGWVGTVLPVDHPWWSTHYPPNGWGCQCGVRQISGREAGRQGYVEGAEAPPVDLRPWRNKRTSETVMVPNGIDPGWQTNPGKHRAANMSMIVADRLAELPLRARPAAVADLVASPAFRHFAEDAMRVGLERAKAVPALRAEGLAGRALADRLQQELPFSFTRFPVAVAPSRFGDDFLPVSIDAATIGHAADHRAVIDARHWTEIGRIVREGSARRGRDGRVRVYDPLTGLFLVLERRPDRWSVVTIYPVKPGYFARVEGEEL